MNYQVRRRYCSSTKYIHGDNGIVTYVFKFNKSQYDHTLTSNRFVEHYRSIVHTHLCSRKAIVKIKERDYLSPIACKMMLTRVRVHFHVKLARIIQVVNKSM